MRIKMLNAKNGEFTGKILSQEFTDQQLRDLGYTRENAPMSILVLGEYYQGTFGDEEQLDQILGATAFGAENGKQVAKPRLVSMGKDGKGLPTYGTEWGFEPAQHWINLDPEYLRLM